jgi:tetratricopeptide (TPR) repeat protein
VQKRLNVRLLFRAVAVVLVVGTAVHVVHGFQVRRQARAYLLAGEDAAAANDLDRATNQLRRYLAVRPGDLEAQLKYGLLLERMAHTDAARQRAYRYLEQVIRQDPDNVLLRQTLGHLAVQLGRFADAARHLRRLRHADVDRAELEQTLAWCYLGSGDTEQAAECFASAIRIAPQRVINYVQLAELWLRLDQAGRARRVMDDLIAANRESAAAFAARSRYFQATGRLEDAATDVARALRLTPTNADILLQAAELASARDRLEEARQFLQHGVTTRPKDVRFPLTLARLQEDTGHQAEALTLLRRAGDHPEVLTLLGDLLLAQGDAPAAAAVMKHLRRVAPANSPWVAYLEAEAQAQRGDWVAAARSFEALRTRLPLPAWQARAQLGLARVYGACGDARRLEACRHAVALEPSRRALLTLLQALLAAEQMEEAARVGERLMQRPEAPPPGWLAWTRALIRRNAARSKTQADWNEPREVLREAERAGADPVQVVLLRADLLVAQGRAGQARDLLHSQAAQRPTEVALAAGLADLARRDGKPRAGLRLLRGARARKGAVDGADWRLAQIRCVQAADSLEDGARALEEAGRGLERLSADAQRRVFQALVAALRQRGDVDAATVMCRRWNRSLSSDLTARLVLFDLAVAAGAEEALREVLADMRRIEGEQGVYWRCGEVMRLLVRWQQDSDQRLALAQARKLLGEAGRLQPRWGRVAALAARLDEIEGRPDRALENYLRAFEQGDRHEWLAERLVRLLMERQRVADAAGVVRIYQQEAEGRIGRGQALPPALARLGCEAALRLRDLSRTAELARLAVPENAHDYREHLWLADVLESAGRPTEAGRVLERLTETSGDIPDTWVALLRHLVHLGRWERVEGVLEKAAAKLEGAGLARCYEAAARVKQAERAYRKALKEAPADSLLRRNLARFYLFHDQPEKAFPHLRLLATPAAVLPEHAAWARRMLATLPFQLAALGRPAPDDRRPVTEAAGLRLLGRNHPNGDESVADRRARALVLAADRSRLGAGLRLFEETLPQQPLTPEDRFRLAQLCELAGASERADGLMVGLLGEHPHNAQYLAGQVRLLLTRGDQPEARRWLKRLEKVEPDTPRTRSLREALR